MDQLLGHKSEYLWSAHANTLLLSRAPSGPLAIQFSLCPNLTLVSHIHSRICCGGLEASTPLGSTGCLVLPTRKVQSLRTYRHLRLLTGTPCLIRVIQNSLFMAINDILRNSNSGFLWSIPQSISSCPELMVVKNDVALLVLILGNLLLGIKYKMNQGLIPPW